MVRNTSGKYDTQPKCLILDMLNKLRCHIHFKFSTNQITWFRLLIKNHILNDKQCRSRSVAIFRSQQIWIYTVCKGRVYLGSAGQGLIFTTLWANSVNDNLMIFFLLFTEKRHWHSCKLSSRDSLHEMSKPVFWKKKIKIHISTCRLLKFSPSILSVFHMHG